jgi:trehalose 6-phosphate phosphatase
MTPLLSRENAAALAPLARTHSLLAFDFDGTLAPIRSAREEALMRDSTATLFAGVCARYPVAVVSGRSLEDVSSRLGGATVKYVVGNHGIEPGNDLEAVADIVAVAFGQLEAALKGCPGVEIEDKRYSLSVHFRQAPDARMARERILAAIASLSMCTRVIAGKMVVNVVPDGASHKGDALLELLAREGAEASLYVGDDATDEDVFALAGPTTLVKVRVGESAQSRAGFFLRDQSEMDALLRELLRLRPVGRHSPSTTSIR